MLWGKVIERGGGVTDELHRVDDPENPDRFIFEIRLGVGGPSPRVIVIRDATEAQADWDWLRCTADMDADLYAAVEATYGTDEGLEGASLSIRQQIRGQKFKAYSREHNKRHPEPDRFGGRPWPKAKRPQGPGVTRG